MYSETQANLFLLKTPSLPPKAIRHPLKNIDGTGLCTFVDIGSIFYLSVQGTYFYQVIFGTKFEIFWEPKHPERHEFYWDQRIMILVKKNFNSDIKPVVLKLYYFGAK